MTDLIDAVAAAKAAGASDAELEKARAIQRRAQWRLDFVSSDNSMGFHAPQEAAKILGEGIDLARQGAARAPALSARPAQLR